MTLYPALIVAALISAGSIGAQSTPTQALSAHDALQPGVLRGTVAVQKIATTLRNADEQPVSGTAQWRIELDSLDWRRKLTLRLTLADSANTVVVVRAADAEMPQRVLKVKSNTSSLVDRRFFTASMTIRERGALLVFEWHDIAADSITFASADLLRPSTVLRGTIRLLGLRAVSPGTPGWQLGQLTSRIVAGEFAATFDPRPVPAPRMTSDTQTRIMRDALDDFTLNWMNGRVNAGAADSTADNDKARAFLTSRWDAAAMVDSVAVGDKVMFVRMRGKYWPVTCTARHNDSAPRCTTAFATDTVPDGEFRGALAVEEDAANRTGVQPQTVSGAARWRLELDSLDWRRKLTLRLTLAGPEHAVYVIRTSSANAPHGVLTVKNVASSHIDPRYYTARLYLREKGEQRTYDYWDIGEDNIVFSAGDSLSGSAVLRGTIRLRGFHALSHRRGVPSRQQMTRLVVGTFAATFDPTPEPVPSTMTTEVQTTILQRALYDFASNWISNRVNASVKDSTADNDKARAFLLNRWSEVAFIDSVAVSEKALFVRIRGRFVPVTCILDGRYRGSLCGDMSRR